MDHRAPLWTLLGIFVVFKLATTAMILAAEPDGAAKTIWLFIAFHWPFMLAGLLVGAFFLTVSILFRVRLMRVRGRRRELEAAEWMTDSMKEIPR